MTRSRNPAPSRCHCATLDGGLLPRDWSCTYLPGGNATMPRSVAEGRAHVHTRGKTGCRMARIRDEGSEFDAPIGVVWRFLQSPEVHLAAHKGERNHRVERISESTLLSHSEMEVQGQWVPVTNRVTMVPPVATIVEVLRGPLAGTKLVHVYTPAGNKTRIDVYGELTLPGLSEEAVSKMGDQVLGAVFDVDNEALRRFASERSRS